jgi:hypothetical protein
MAPTILHGTDDSGESATFCKVESSEKDRIILSLSNSESSFQPTFIKYSKAEKELSRNSLHPTLGIDATMPQHRHSANSEILPTQDQYPVWYFFYGTLADPLVLKRLLGLSDEPDYQPARVRGGTLTTWGGKYRALVDGPATGPDPSVQGRAFLVKTRDQEEILCCYESDRYEVVRCNIEMEPTESVKGLTFRFPGNAI